MNLIIHDETVAGSILNQVKISLPTETVKVADLIKARVVQEVKEFNHRRPEYYRGIVPPAEAEVALNGYRLTKRHRLNVGKQCLRALEAFQRKDFLLIIDETKIDDPNHVIEIKPHTKISFLRLNSPVRG